MAHFENVTLYQDFWSMERDPSLINAKIFSKEATICLKLWTSGYQWAKSVKDIICHPNDTSTLYYIPAHDIQSISGTDLKKYTNRTWTTFNQFKISFNI
jgi:hypothetical protein